MTKEKNTGKGRDQGSGGKGTPSTSRDDFTRKSPTQVNDGKKGNDTTNSTGPGKTTNDKKG